ncbi:SMI1/KNR4 family protein [Marinagarivorans algicola]|uniref:SMI1/KNR4 family protein n=1 Tax=Marinagarivorans algicola TaxID=1513270 RepID=UPI00155D8CE5|nr:SMI1/KNR4 family protein [Marinagarivorans algicola]
MSSLSDIKSVLEKLKLQDEDGLHFGSGASQKLVEQVEHMLGLPLHQDYKDFLLNIGTVDHCDNRICGLYFKDKLGGGYGDVIYETEELFESYREYIPQGYTVLNSEPLEWYYLIHHDTGKVYHFDPFSKQLDKHYDDVLTAIHAILEGGIDPE